MPFSAEQKRVYRTAQTPQAIAYREREKERNKQRNKERRYSQDTSIIQYRDNERRRNAVRHHKDWHYQDAIIVVCDGEADDNGNYRWLQFRAKGQMYTLKAPTETSVSFTRAAHYALNLRKRLKAEYGTNHIYFYWFSMGYDMDQLIGHDKRISDDNKKQLIKHRARDWGLVRPPGWSNEVILEDIKLAVHNGRKEVQTRFLKSDKVTGQLKLDKDGIPESYAQLIYFDVFSLSAQSFVKLMKDMSKTWTTDEHKDFDPLLERITTGKLVRGIFSESGWGEQEILEYNESELILLEWYMYNLVKLCQSDDVKLQPRSFAGPAPMARALLTKYGVTEHIKPTDYDTLEYQHSPLFQSIKHAYFGGRIELAGFGMLSNFYLYDIRSAYPDALRQLVCMAHGKWVHKLLPDKEALADFSVIRISWHTYKQDRFGPFPVRRKDGSIHYPLNGQGWYYTPEIKAYINGQRGQYRMYECYQWQPECPQEYPFRDMIEHTYTTRARLKEEGNAAQLPLKLAMNSIYGIFAQRSGSHANVDELGVIQSISTPKFSNLFAAGYVTSYTRAHLYSIYCKHSDLIYAFATDSVYSFDQLEDMNLGEQLGQWEGKLVDEQTAFVAPGIVLSANKAYQRTRGFAPNDDTYKLIEQGMIDKASHITIPGKHYVDMRQAFAAKDGVWGVFVPHVRNVSIDELALKTKRDFSRHTNKNGLHICPPYLGVDNLGKPYELLKPNMDNEVQLESYSV